MTALVLIEAENGRIRQGSRSAVAAASRFGDVDALLLGKAGTEAASKLPGIRKVLHVPALDHALAEPAAALLASLAESYSHILSAASSTGKNILPRLAGLLDAQPISDVVAIKDDATFVRPIYAGNALATVQSSDSIKIMTVRSSSFDPVEEEGGSAPIDVLDAPADDGKSGFVKLEQSQSDRPELEVARVVISGGKGLKDASNFHTLLEPVADKLGAAIGASRAAVDSGFAPNEMQVGQTGKVVAPELYIATGLSGAIQHLAGMKDSRVIVAINIDPEAPIFKVADYGMVGDLFELLPALEKAL
ncbi:electron transfer flavoprotein subunit alpha [Parasaccharibacter sp. TMW2.1882]|uniref:Electron transfer flavoprotein subunit alpha n=1 Tax=Parasaccharibacter apium TaxID=1510841 RepID=A0A7U7G4W3_9PROT|nr:MULTISPECIES: FAD-binding protein [Acetobacteraceae]MCK8637737.1 electron transfer flavoprotein subunit alpha [Parasaccharibacter sp. TMW2.1885]MCL1496860.1 electron transfer flavoprotein subunit alpha [Parasaccharibacter sp. TMW2.1882]CDG33191.1 Electron transfer flavoprotein, alpha subunit [Parasaccharibacter apium]